MKQIVCNASPLITLAKADLLQALPEQYSTILCPQAVFDEILAGPLEDELRRILPDLPWLQCVRLDPPISPLASWHLGRGESEVIEYARLNPTTIALLDDRAARRSAMAVGVPVYGTLSIIAQWVAKTATISLQEAVMKLRKAGLYVNDRTILLVEALLEDLLKGKRL